MTTRKNDIQTPEENFFKKTTKTKLIALKRAIMSVASSELMSINTTLEQSCRCGGEGNKSNPLHPSILPIK
jgi:hypothetical protein